MTKEQQRELKKRYPILHWKHLIPIGISLPSLVLFYFIYRWILSLGHSDMLMLIALIGVSCLFLHDIIILISTIHARYNTRRSVFHISDGVVFRYDRRAWKDNETIIEAIKYELFDEKLFDSLMSDVYDALVDSSDPRLPEDMPLIFITILPPFAYSWSAYTRFIDTFRGVDNWIKLIWLGSDCSVRMARHKVGHALLEDVVSREEQDDILEEANLC